MVTEHSAADQIMNIISAETRKTQPAADQTMNKISAGRGRSNQQEIKP